MNRCVRIFCFALAGFAALQCTKRRINIEKPFVEQVITEFTQERVAYYMHGGAPKPNAELMEKTLSRHGVKLFDFKPPFRRFYPEIYTRLLGS